MVTICLCAMQESGLYCTDDRSDNESISEDEFLDNEHSMANNSRNEQSAAADDDETEAFDDSSYHVPLYDGCTVSVGAAVVLLMTLSLRHNLPWVAVEDILTLLNFLLPTSSFMPKSRYLFEKLFTYLAGI